MKEFYIEWREPVWGGFRMRKFRFYTAVQCADFININRLDNYAVYNSKGFLVSSTSVKRRKDVLYAIMEAMSRQVGIIMIPQIAVKEVEELIDREV